MSIFTDPEAIFGLVDFFQRASIDEIKHVCRLNAYMKKTCKTNPYISQIVWDKALDYYISKYGYYGALEFAIINKSYDLLDGLIKKGALNKINQGQEIYAHLGEEGTKGIYNTRLLNLINNSRNMSTSEKQEMMRRLLEEPKFDFSFDMYSPFGSSLEDLKLDTVDFFLNVPRVHALMQSKNLANEYSMAIHRTNVKSKTDFKYPIDLLFTDVRDGKQFMLQGNFLDLINKSRTFQRMFSERNGSMPFGTVIKIPIPSTMGIAKIVISLMEPCRNEEVQKTIKEHVKTFEDFMIYYQLLKFFVC